MHPQRLEQLLAGFRDRQVLVVGDVMLDEYIWGTTNRISPEAPVMVVDADRHTYTPGGAANVVSNLRALGAHARVIGVVGDDPAGQMLMEELANHQVDHSRLIVDPARPTTTKTRVIARSQQVLRIDHETRAGVSPEVVAQVSAVLEELLPEMDGLIFSDYRKGVLVPPLVERALALAARHNVLVAVNPKPASCPMFRQAALMTLNRVEVEGASGVEVGDLETLRRVGQVLVDGLTVEALVVTWGEEGAVLFQRDQESVHVPAVRVEVYDEAGAGDTTISALTLGRLAGAPWEEAVRLAMYAAAAAVQKVGVATVTPQEVQAIHARTHEMGSVMRDT
jgi:D-beta-D-heptose 7-phosphate kinase/D-beta-D-heptose 1-phosphate adenosyltransferase